MPRDDMKYAELQYREVNAQRAIDGNSFSQGVIDYNFSTGSPTCWVPTKSYFRTFTLQFA